MGRPTGLVTEYCEDVSEGHAITTLRRMDRELMPAWTETDGDEWERWMRRRFVEVSLGLVKHLSSTLGSSPLGTCNEEERFNNGVKAHGVGPGLNWRGLTGRRRRGIRGRR